MKHIARYNTEDTEYTIGLDGNSLYIRKDYDCWEKAKVQYKDEMFYFQLEEGGEYLSGEDFYWELN